MKRIFSVLLGMSMTFAFMSAQDIDKSFVFVDENGTEIEHGATVVRNQVEIYGDEVSEVIYSGISVKQNQDATTDYLRVRYNVTQIDNGVFQLCFPMTCNMHREVGNFLSGEGSVMPNPQDIQSEWFPVEDGACVVTMSIEVMDKVGFPPKYEFVAQGPSMTLRFEKSSTTPGTPGDVNGDGNVNISDINMVIDYILNPRSEFAVADVNNDGNVNISDINAVIALILNS